MEWFVQTRQRRFRSIEVALPDRIGAPSSAVSRLQYWPVSYAPREGARIPTLDNVWNRLSTGEVSLSLLSVSGRLIPSSLEIYSPRGGCVCVRILPCFLWCRGDAQLPPLGWYRPLSPCHWPNLPGPCLLSAPLLVVCHAPKGHMKGAIIALP